LLSHAVTKTALPGCDPTRLRTDPNQGDGILTMQGFGGGSPIVEQGSDSPIQNSDEPNIAQGVAQ